MDLILAVDLKAGQVVHGSAGMRDTYQPLTWGLSGTAVPEEYVRALSPEHLYIADLDRITGAGENTAAIMKCSALVDTCFVDRGCRTPADYLDKPGIIDIVGTETTRARLSQYHGGYVSLDMKGGLVVPSGEKPLPLLQKACNWDFQGAIILNIGAVGTGGGIPEELLSGMREAYDKPLLYGGGIASTDDLETLRMLGFDGAIVATAVHRGTIPLVDLRRGAWC